MNPVTGPSEIFKAELKKEFIPLLDGCFVLAFEKSDKEYHWFGSPPRIYEAVDERALERLLGKVAGFAAWLHMKHVQPQVPIPDSPPQIADAASVAARMEQNGVKRPGSGVTKTVWDIADSLREEIGQHPTRQQVVDRSSSFGINSSTAASCYSKWCQFNGINPKDPSRPFVAKGAAPLPPEPVSIAAACPATVAALETYVVPRTRYWSHPESSALWTTEDGHEMEQTDGLVEELDQQQYETAVQAKAQANAISALQVSAPLTGFLPPPPPPPAPPGGYPPPPPPPLQ